MSDLGRVQGGRVVIFSDWHLPPELTAQTEFFGRFAGEVCMGAEQVFVLGDLFGAWVGPKHAGRPGHAAALNALEGLAKAGSRVTLVRGNRDFLMDRGTAGRYGLHLARAAWRGEVGGFTARMSHGDELTEDDRLHKTLRAITGNFPVSTLVRSMPLRMSDALADGYRWLSDHRRTRRKKKNLWPSGARLRAEFASGTDLIVIGHWHTPRIETDALGMAGKTFVMLGECTAQDACYAEVSGGRIEMRHFRTGGISDF